MLKEILNTIKQKFSLEEKKGVFISIFDKKGNFIYSKGSIFTDKPIKNTISILIEAMPSNIKKNAGLIIVDVVKNIIQLNNMEDILATDIKKYGLLIIGVNKDDFGVILPDVEGVVDVKNALYLIKKKYNIQEKQVIIYRFDTQRFTIKL